MLRIGVIGYGYWGPNLVRNFQRVNGASVARIADLNPVRLKVAERDCRGIDLVIDPEEVTEADDIDLVVIATPICSHFELAMEALRHGKHVLVEKPMTHSVATSERLLAEAERRGLTLMVDHTFVYTDAVRWMKEFVSRGELGELYYMDAVRTNLGLFQHDASVIWDLAPHDLAIVHWVSGRKAISVSATGSCHAGSRVPDIAYLTVDLGDEAIAHVHVNWLSPVKVRRLMVAGSRRMIVFDDMETSEKVKVYDSGVSLEHQNVDGEYRMQVDYRLGDMMSPSIKAREALHREAEHVVRCVAGEETPLVNGEDGLEVVRVLEAAQRSLELGGERVKL